MNAYKVGKVNRQAYNNSNSNSDFSNTLLSKFLQAAVIIAIAAVIAHLLLPEAIHLLPVPVHQE